MVVPLLGLFLALAVATPGAAGTIVPKADWISDARARLLLADLLAMRPATLPQAEEHYRLLLRLQPDNGAARMGLATTLYRQGRLPEAEQLVSSPVRGSTEGARLNLLADIFFAQGRMAEAARTYQQALDAGADAKGILPSLARALIWSGDTAQALALLESLLAQSPDDPELLLLSAQALLQAGRYQRAGETARTLRGVLPREPGVLADLADLEAGLGHARAARDLYQEALSLDDSPAMRLRAADTGLLWGDFTQALRAYQSASEASPGDPVLRLKQAEAYFASQRLAEAEEVCRLLLLERPDDAEAQALLRRVLAEDGRAPDTAPVRSAVPWEADSPPELTQRAAALADKGEYAAALALLDQALADDPEHFPARMARLEYLAYSGNHGPALAGLRGLSEQFPESGKLLLTEARVLAWAERYQESLDAYAQLQRADPTDPVPLREAARVAFWGKMRDQGLVLYSRLWELPVDQAVPGAPPSDPDVPWDGYERWAASNPADQRTVLQWLAEYRIQKEAWLEAQAKDLAWNKRFGPAVDTLETLVGFAPGNQEALFDLAQAACALGLCHEENQAYLQLLELDPLHTLAREALARQETRDSPALRVEGSFWQERGRGDLAQMVRYQQAALFSLPLDCAWTLTLGEKYWLERPLKHSDSFSAWGHVLAISGVLDDTWRIDGQWTRKYYQEHGLGDYDLGRARLGVDLDGILILGLGYERLEELANIYALRQKIRSDNIFLDYLVNVTREVTLSGEGRLKYYSDSNQGWRAAAALGWALTDHPRMLKLSLLGEYRDTNKESLTTTIGPDKVVEHPYWTPQNYLAGAVALEWTHDLSEEYYCGALDNIYQLRLVLGTDNEDNPSIQLEGSWDYDLDEHWSLDVTGLWHRSEAWDASGLWTGLEYHF